MRFFLAMLSQQPESREMKMVMITLYSPFMQSRTTVQGIEKLKCPVSLLLKPKWKSPYINHEMFFQADLKFNQVDNYN